MALIDIGAAATTRGQYSTWNVTQLSVVNPANATGIITSVEIYARTSLEGCRVGTFYLISGTTYKCRDSVVIGAVASGAKRTFPGLSIDVVTGDLIGIYFTAGQLEQDFSGYDGVYQVAGEHIDPGDQVSYSLLGGDEQSLYGEGEEVAVVGRSFGFIMG